MVILGEKRKQLIHVKNDALITEQLFYAKKGSQKQLILEKYEDFENGKKWPLGKDYSFCKMVILGQKRKQLIHVENDA